MVVIVNRLFISVGRDGVKFGKVKRVRDTPATETALGQPIKRPQRTITLEVF